ncbi:MAG: 16S rRNA (guanine(966)-N(2))-methyltransferase RsmD [Candidatus Omnitrophica bacterium]|nr:16S rRNA (guanine(966)-N(2))-methyltransferase RsmD [Candidatus Omnitrophota bacterium]
MTPDKKYLKMRIIAGEYRGRRIKQPASGETRPTKDRVREAVFNMIAGQVPGAYVLDLFSGSGAYALEALSRGAEKAVMIENDRLCVDAIKENVKVLGAGGRSEVIEADVFGSVEGLNAKKEQFDLIFADPPYKKDMVKKALIIVNHYDILKHIGFFILEHHVDEDIPGIEGNVSLYKQKTYGKTAISVFKKND